MIAILDWGIGGCGFYRELKSARPDAGVIYWSDSGFTPYGKVETGMLTRRVEAVAHELAKRGAKQLVIACNAASTVLPRLGVDGDEGEIAGLRVTGVISHAVRLADRSTPLGKPPRSRASIVGVIGGGRTIRSGIYRRAFAGKGRSVIQRVAQPLSGRIEAGDLSSVELDDDLRVILGPLRHVDSLLLACTHYPAIAPAIQRFVPSATLLDPIPTMIRWVLANWQLEPSSRADRFLTTGDPEAMKQSARLAFSVEIAAPELVSL